MCERWVSRYGGECGQLFFHHIEMNHYLLLTLWLWDLGHADRSAFGLILIFLGLNFARSGRFLPIFMRAQIS